MKKHIKRLMHYFFKGAYAIAYRYMEDKYVHFDGETYFRVINPTLHRWFADPFPVCDSNSNYIFAEIVDDKNGNRGTIGVCDLSKNEEFVEIINEPFHMSFPNVFKHNDQYYMLPETSEISELRLYKANSFPYEWVYYTTLLKNYKIVDTVIMEKDGEVIAIGQKLPEKKNVAFAIDFENETLRELQLSGSFVNKRPAGNFIRYSDGIYHALQESGRVYGEYLHICRLNGFDNGFFDETEVAQFRVTDMRFESCRIKKYRRVHTFNRCKNLEVVDLLYYQFNPTIIPEKIKHMLKQLS